MMRFTLSRTLVASGLCLAASSAWAHAGPGLSGGLLGGFVHPLLGWDHVVAMVAVGLWGAFLGRPAIWSLPLAFPLAMTAGCALGVAGVALSGVEVAIALSAIVLGAMVAFSARLSAPVAAAIVAAFAVFHGQAHGLELADATDPIAYGIGFVIATSLLHATGIVIGRAIRWPRGRDLVRACGAAVLASGAFLLTQQFA